MIYHFLGKALMYQSPKIIFVCSLTSPRQLSHEFLCHAEHNELLDRKVLAKAYNHDLYAVNSMQRQPQVL